MEETKEIGTLRASLEEEKEMDRKLNIAKRKQKAVVNLRKVNGVQERLLAGQLTSLENRYTRHTKQLRKETYCLQKELEELDPEKTIKDDRLVLPSVPSSVSLVGSASRHSQASSDPSWPPSRSSSRIQATEQNRCIFGTQQPNKCAHFPCYLPQTYNSLGFQMKPVSYSRLKNYGQLLRRCRDRRPPTSHGKRTSSDSDEEDEQYEDHSPPPRISVKEKERGLRQLVKEMRERNHKNKPKDWSINYGAPVPRRTLMYPVQPIKDAYA